jgi:hypothetical protein
MWEGSCLRADWYKQYWEKKGVNPGKLLNNTYLNPHTGHHAGMELLLSIKERADGYKFKSCDDEAAINVVNAQTENAKYHSARSKRV